MTELRERELPWIGGEDVLPFANPNSEYRRTDLRQVKTGDFGFSGDAMSEEELRELRSAKLQVKTKCYLASSCCPGSLCLTRKLQIVSLALRSWLVLPTIFSTSNCSSPGQVFPPPFKL